MGTCAIASVIALSPATGGLTQESDRWFRPYAVKPLPFIPIAMNNAGDVVGMMDAEDGRHAVALIGGVLVDLHREIPGPSDEKTMWVYDINDKAQVLGQVNYSARVSGPDECPEHCSFIYDDGQFTYMPQVFQGLALNDRGDVVGGGGFPERVCVRAAMWRNGTVRELGRLRKGCVSRAHGINNRGDVVGTSDRNPPPAYRPFLWVKGRMKDLHALSCGSSGFDINQHRQIVGVLAYCGVPARPFYWHPGGGFIDIAKVTDRWGRATDVNESGEVIGFSASAEDYRVAWMFVDGQAIPLNDLVPEPGWHFSEAFDINDEGQMVALGWKAGEVTGVFLTPLADRPLNTNVFHGPTRRVRSTTATFRFEATREGTSYECSLDGSAFRECSSPVTYGSLRQGPHSWRVRASDDTGVETRPAKMTWDVSPVRIVAVHPEPRKGRAATDEWVRLRNFGAKRVNLSRLRLATFDRENVYRFPALWLATGETVTVHSGKGRDTASHLYAGRSSGAWGDDWDHVVLLGRGMPIRDDCGYGMGGRPVVRCRPYWDIDPPDYL